MTGGRWRIVTQQDGREPCVSSVVLSLDEAAGQMESEARLHEWAGWRVEQDDLMLTCRRGDRLRVVRAVEFSPMADRLARL